MCNFQEVSDLRMRDYLFPPPPSVGLVTRWKGICILDVILKKTDFYRPQPSWGKVIFSQASVILSTWEGCLVHAGACSGGGPYSGGAPGPGGSGPGGAWWRPPRDGYCCGRYASYWNTFLCLNIFGASYVTSNKTR